LVNYKELPEVRARRIRRLEADLRRQQRYIENFQARPTALAYHSRWAKHYENRLTYERAMLAADGGLLADQTKPEAEALAGACGVRAAAGRTFKR
jgi:hypothetical protein